MLIILPCTLYSDSRSSSNIRLFERIKKPSIATLPHNPCYHLECHSQASTILNGESLMLICFFLLREHFLVYAMQKWPNMIHISPN